MKPLLFFTLPCFILLISCTKKGNTSKDIYLTDEDKSWNIYHVGDSLKFMSNFNHKRNYTIRSVYDEMVEQSQVEHPYKYEQIAILGSRLDTNSGDFNIKISRGLMPTYGLIIAAEIKDFVSRSQIVDILSYGHIDTLKVNNIIYHDVIKMVGMDTLMPGFINTIYYNKDKGFLRYESKTGEIWDRTN